MKRSDVLAILAFWIVVAGLIAVRVVVGPTEVHRADAVATNVEMALDAPPVTGSTR